MLREYMDVAGQGLPPDDNLPTTQRSSTPLSLVADGGLRIRPGVSMRTASTLMATIERLESVIDEETSELKQNKPVDLRDFNLRKSQGLLELTRLMRGLGPADKEMQAGLARLRVKLDTNLGILRLHLEAAQEVAALISRVIQDAESDGTYNSSINGRD